LEQAKYDNQAVKKLTSDQAVTADFSAVLLTCSLIFVSMTVNNLVFLSSQLRDWTHPKKQNIVRLWYGIALANHTHTFTYIISFIIF